MRSARGAARDDGKAAGASASIAAGGAKASQTRRNRQCECREERAHQRSPDRRHVSVRPREIAISPVRAISTREICPACR